jgi:hypothetical protein
MAAFSQVGPVPNPIAQKITAEHITELLSLSR